MGLKQYDLMTASWLAAGVVLILSLEHFETYELPAKRFQGKEILSSSVEVMLRHSSWIAFLGLHWL